MHRPFGRCKFAGFGDRAYCEICNQLSGNNLDIFEKRPFAFWECVEVSSCPLMSRADSTLIQLVKINDLIAATNCFSFTSQNVRLLDDA